MIRAGIETDPKDLFQYAELNKKRKRPMAAEDNSDISGSEGNELLSKRDVADLPEITTNNLKRSESGPIKRITVYFGNNEYHDFLPE
jgi:hypothetical protein